MKYIIAPAQTGSEWDSVEFLLIEATPERINQLKVYVKKAKRIESEGFNSVSVYADNANFYTDLSELPEETQIDIDNEQVKQIELDPDFVETLSKPEQDLKYGEMKFGMDQITFSTHGKHTDEEYWGYVSYDFINNLNL